jgi:hypothetical protein
MPQQKYASWASKDTRETSTLPTNFDARITGARFTKEAPDNYTADGNPIFFVQEMYADFVKESQETDEDYEARRHVSQSYSLGAKAGDEFTISPDGYGLIPSGDETAIRKGSNFDLLKCSYENEGVPESITAAGDASKLIDIYARFKRIETVKLLGKERDFGEDKKRKSKFPPQVLVCVKLLSLPGEKAAEKSNGAAVATASTADLDTLTGAYLVKALEGLKGKQAQRSQLILHVSKAAVGEGQKRAEIARRSQDEDFLKAAAETGIVAGNVLYQVTYDGTASPQTVSISAV